MENFFPADADRRFLTRLPPTTEAPVPRGEIPPLLLAAWTERRLSEDETEAVEASLCDDADLLDDALAIMAQGAEVELAALEVPSAALLARLQALVPEPTATVVPIRPVARRSSRRSVGVWLSWGAVAASVALVSFVGFDLGSMVSKSEIAQTSAAADSTSVFNDDLE